MRFAAMILLGAALAPAQDPTLEQGKAVFRSNCAFCHGLTGRGGRGPNLVSGQLQHGNSDEDMKSVIRGGVPGTTMPAFDTLEKDDLDALVSFLHTLSGNAGDEKIAGDAEAGRTVYQRSGCAGCHRIGDEGSVYGPELTRIGAGRSAAYLRESLVKPSADIPEEAQGVSVVLRDGKKITGVRVNEDTFSVQLRDPAQRFRMFDKADVRDVIHETKSLMPAYDRLAPQDLDDLLAFLQTLRGGLHTGAGVKKVGGIR